MPTRGPTLVGMLLIVALVPLPTADAGGTSTGLKFLCDQLPSKCAATLGYTASTCAPFSASSWFGTIEGEACILVAGVAGATVIRALPWGIHDIEPVNSARERDPCHDRYMQVEHLLTTTGCAKGVRVPPGCGQSASVTATATNFNSVAAPNGFAASNPCPASPPPPPCWACICFDIKCPGIAAPDIEEDLPDPIIQFDPPRPGNGICVSDPPGLPLMMNVFGTKIFDGSSEADREFDCPAYSFRLGDLDEETRQQLRDQAASKFLQRFEEESAGWPDEPLAALLRGMMRKAVLDLSYLEEDAMGVLYT